ncbi:MAG: hypothetical protein O2973_04290 [Gemmatimonadetes bacterium]|nr:hypothetical protein [Gemmatimonadota bacterium]
MSRFVRVQLTNAATAFALASVLSVTTAPLAAQVVGRVPEEAVLKDLFDGQRLGVFGGWLTTGLDPVGVRAHSGPIAGVRYTVLMASPLYFSMRLFGVRTEHNVLVPSAPAAARRAGTASGNLLGFDSGFELALTGERAWRGVQPLLTGGVGFITGALNSFDAGGYSPGVSALYSYGLAMRFPTGQNGELRADVGWLVHQMRYPSTFRTEFSGDGAPLRATGTLTPLTSNRAMTLAWTWGIFR